MLEGFEKCCISNVLIVCDDMMLWYDSEEVLNGGSECEEDEGTDFEGVESKNNKDGFSDTDKGR
jgi:hypothetical protein